MEAMITLRGLKLHAVEIIDECLASDLRKQAPMLLDLLLECADKPHRPRLRAVKECESNDLWIISRAVRNTLAHGVLTSNGAGVTRSKRQRHLQERLAAAVLRAADEQFSQWFAAMGAGSVPP
jgi:hypothetical protein